MSWTQISISSLITFVITWFIKSYVDSYLRKKGENLATKEDVAEITRKVEEVKSEVSVKLELLKWQLGKKATIHKLAAEREFDALTEIGAALYAMKLATMNLRPVLDRVDPNEPEEQRNARRSQEWAKSHDSFMDVVEKHRLFLPKFLYVQFCAIRQVSRKEGLGFEVAVRFGRGGPLSVEAFQDGQKNTDEMNTRLESALDAIRQRYEIDA
jgi:hypothetical protein